MTRLTCKQRLILVHALIKDLEETPLISTLYEIVHPAMSRACQHRDWEKKNVKRFNKLLQSKI